MNRLGQILALAGLALAVWLFADAEGAAAWDLLLTAGFGLVGAGLFHAVPMVANARAWQVLHPGAGRPSLARMTLAVWIREAVNGLLPVARVGGELVGYRYLRRIGVRRAPAAAGLVVDMALSVLSQFVFALMAVALLVHLRGGGGFAAQLALGLLATLPLGIGFVLAQRAGMFARVAGLLNRVAAGKLEGLLGQSARIDRAIALLYRRRDVILVCFVWQLVAWLLGAGEIWLALWALGHPVGLLEALAIEGVIQAVASAAFVVPGALGVQEGGFVLVAVALGLPREVGLALAAARRVRDAVVFFPGLLAWQWIERASAGRRLA